VARPWKRRHLHCLRVYLFVFGLCSHSLFIAVELFRVTVLEEIIDDLPLSSLDISLRFALCEYDVFLGYKFSSLKICLEFENEAPATPKTTPATSP